MKLPPGLELYRGLGGLAELPEGFYRVRGCVRVTASGCVRPRIVCLTSPYPHFRPAPSPFQVPLPFLSSLVPRFIGACSPPPRLRRRSHADAFVASRRSPRPTGSAEKNAAAAAGAWRVLAGVGAQGPPASDRG